MRVLISVLLLYPLFAIPQVSTHMPSEELGQIEIDHTHLAWPAPEQLMRDLQSADDAARTKALKLLGATDPLIHVPIWSEGANSHVTGTTVTVPGQTLLRTAHLSKDDELAVVVAAELPDEQMMLGAVAIPRENHWERIAAFSCWCKYERGDAFTNFVQLVPSPLFGGSSQRYELVVRASGGGTGLYIQDEGHFRIDGGELCTLIHFVVRERSCDPTAPSQGCALDRRWFVPSDIEGKSGAVLVHAIGRFPEAGTPAIDLTRGIEDHLLHNVSCKAYLWNEEKFRYERSSIKPQICAAK